ncbi:MAG: segregation/condensation protein A [Patescibacteria group bacterium]
MHEISIEKFQGPLDVLLQLIEQEKLDITEVSLAQVTDQYIKYLKTATELNPDEVADFLVVAAKLLLIKSRVLLPMLNLGGEEEEKDLERQLKIYKEFLEASKVINRMWNRQQVMYAREKPLILKDEPKFTPPRGLTSSILKEVWEMVIKKIEPIIKLPQTTLTKVISINEKIQELKKRILAKAHLNWYTFVAEAKDKIELIVSFLALLELVKQREIIVKQAELFQDISITSLNNDV